VRVSASLVSRLERLDGIPVEGNIFKDQLVTLPKGTKCKMVKAKAAITFTRFRFALADGDELTLELASGARLSLDWVKALLKRPDGIPIEGSPIDITKGTSIKTGTARRGSFKNRKSTDVDLSVAIPAETKLRMAVKYAQFRFVLLCGDDLEVELAYGERLSLNEVKALLKRKDGIPVKDSPFKCQALDIATGTKVYKLAVLTSNSTTSPLSTPQPPQPVSKMKKDNSMESSSTSAGVPDSRGQRETRPGARPAARPAAKPGAKAAAQAAAKPEARPLMKPGVHH
jgi:hypothetical protein